MIEFNNILHGEEISKAIPRTFNPIHDHVISRTNKDGKLLGGVTFDGYTGSCVFIHQAGFDRRWLSRDLLWVIFDYTFNQLRCKKAVGIVPSSNAELLAFNERLGFKYETQIEDGYPDGNMLVLSMKRDECRWLDLKPKSIRSGRLI